MWIPTDRSICFDDCNFSAIRFLCAYNFPGLVASFVPESDPVRLNPFVPLLGTARQRASQPQPLPWQCREETGPGWPGLAWGKWTGHPGCASRAAPQRFAALRLRLRRRGGCAAGRRRRRLSSSPKAGLAAAVGTADATPTLASPNDTQTSRLGARLRSTHCIHSRSLCVHAKFERLNFTSLVFHSQHVERNDRGAMHKADSN